MAALCLVLAACNWPWSREPASNAVTLDARDYKLAMCSAIAYMPQGFGLYQDLLVSARPAGGGAAPHIGDLLQRTGVAGFESRRAGQLSGGMMQKLALSCVLVSGLGMTANIRAGHYRQRGAHRTAAHPMSAAVPK